MKNENTIQSIDLNDNNKCNDLDSNSDEKINKSSYKSVYPKLENMNLDNSTETIMINDEKINMSSVDAATTDPSPQEAGTTFIVEEDKTKKGSFFKVIETAIKILKYITIHAVFIAYFAYATYFFMHGEYI